MYSRMVFAGFRVATSRFRWNAQVLSMINFKTSIWTVVQWNWQFSFQGRLISHVWTMYMLLCRQNKWKLQKLEVKYLARKKTSKKLSNFVPCYYRKPNGFSFVCFLKVESPNDLLTFKTSASSIVRQEARLSLQMSPVLLDTRQVVICISTNFV